LLKAKQELDKIDEDIVYLGDNDFASSELLKVKDEISNMWSIVDREEYMVIKNERVDRDFFRFAFFNNMKNFVVSAKNSRNLSASRSKRREKELQEKLALENQPTSAVPTPQPSAPASKVDKVSIQTPDIQVESAPSSTIVSSTSSVTEETIMILTIEGEEGEEKTMVDKILNKYSEKVSNRKNRQNRQSMRASIGRFVASSMKKADLDAMMEKRVPSDEGAPDTSRDKEKEKGKGKEKKRKSGKRKGRIKINRRS